MPGKKAGLRIPELNFGRPFTGDQGGGKFPAGQVFRGIGV
jgi:hypothetical protein